MNNESYFRTESIKSQPKYYYSIGGINKRKIFDSIQQTKFSRNLMIWIAISEKELSIPTFLNLKKPSQ